MDMASLLITSAAVGFGWQPMPDGTDRYEYLLQIEPEVAAALQEGHAMPIVGEVPEGIGPIGRVRLIVGSSELPRRELSTQFKPWPEASRPQQRSVSPASADVLPPVHSGGGTVSADVLPPARSGSGTAASPPPRFNDVTPQPQLSSGSPAANSAGWPQATQDIVPPRTHTLVDDRGGTAPAANYDQYGRPLREHSIVNGVQPTTGQQSDLRLVGQQDTNNGWSSTSADRAAGNALPPTDRNSLVVPPSYGFAGAAEPNVSQPATEAPRYGSNPATTSAPTGAWPASQADASTSHARSNHNNSTTARSSSLPANPPPSWNNNTTERSYGRIDESSRGGSHSSVPEIRREMLSRPADAALDPPSPRDSLFASKNEPRQSSFDDVSTTPHADIGWDQRQPLPELAAQPVDTPAVSPTAPVGTFPLILSWVLLSGSGAGNLYLFWSYLDVRNKYGLLVRGVDRRESSQDLSK